jgi:hypothetical protein
MNSLLDVIDRSFEVIRFKAWSNNPIYSIFDSPVDSHSLVAKCKTVSVVETKDPEFHWHPFKQLAELPLAQGYPSG